MKSRIVLLTVLGFGGLVSCSQYHAQSYQYMPLYEGYQYGDYQTYTDPDYSQYSDYQKRNEYRQHSSNNNVVVPESYHVGSYRSPASPQRRDNQWVTQQNSQGYTIQLAEGTKASAVAGTLTRAPKRNRMATVKSFENGQAYFRGVYGSYSTYEAAQRALHSLPADLQQKASIKRWGSIKNSY